jgi:hypothetical protein
MVSPQYWGQVPGLVDFEPPASDTMTIVSIHLYRPETFVWQGTRTDRLDWIGTEWFYATPFTEEAERWFAPMITWSAAHPQFAMNIGEFGATKNADNASRERFMRWHARYFEEEGWSHMLWDYYNDYGVYYPDEDSICVGCVDALTDVGTGLPTPLSYTSSTVYQSNFSTTVGWSASTDVSLTASGGNLVATATSASSNYEDRYIYKTFSLQQFHHYKLTILVQSTRSTAVMTLGGPYAWELISGIVASPYWTSYEYFFTFSWPDDGSALLRLCIGGSGTTTLYVAGVLLEEITVP